MQNRAELLNLYKTIPKKMITFDLTGRCNIKCVMCVWHNGERGATPKATLDFSSLKKVVNSILDAGVSYDCINLSVSGEPTLHPDFREIIDYLFSNNENKRLFSVLSLNTNMIPFTRDLIDFTLAKVTPGRGHLFVTCSLNSASKETGILVKKKDFHDRIEDQMKYMIQRKQELGLTYQVKLDLQMLILRETHAEAALFVKKWSDHFIKHGMKFKVVANVFADEDNVINLKREFEHTRQVECDTRFYDTVTRLGLETDVGREYASH